MSGGIILASYQNIAILIMKMESGGNGSNVINDCNVSTPFYGNDHVVKPIIKVLFFFQNSNDLHVAISIPDT